MAKLKVKRQRKGHKPIVYRSYDGERHVAQLVMFARPLGKIPVSDLLQDLPDGTVERIPRPAPQVRSLLKEGAILDVEIGDDGFVACFTCVSDDKERVTVLLAEIGSKLNCIFEVGFSTILYMEGRVPMAPACDDIFAAQPGGSWILEDGVPIKKAEYEARQHAQGSPPDQESTT
jgi:hypothetical protein